MSAKLLILSGMHGDEYEVSQILPSILTKYSSQLPEYELFSPISPSAIQRKTRRNEFGHDVNRQFFDPPTDPEVNAFMENIRGKHFAFSVNFHEDTDLTSTFYMYDSGQLKEALLSKLRSRILSTGAGLHTGKDDPVDANLGYHVDRGYISTPFSILPQNIGFSWVWFHRHSIVDRAMDIEIPGKASIVLKEQLMSIIFDTIPMLGV